MTDTPNPVDQQAGNIQQSLSLLADRKELLRLRLLPVELAIVLSVSKQTISRWIAEGKITPPSPIDGRLDAQAATRQVLRNTPPSKIRARILRQAVDDAQALRDGAEAATARADAAEAALREAQGEIAHLERWIVDGDAHEETFRALLIEHADDLRAAPPEAWEKTLNDLSDAAWDVVDPVDADDALDAMRATHEKKGGGDAQPDPGAALADLELDPAAAAELAAMNAALDAEGAGE